MVDFSELALGLSLETGDEPEEVMATLNQAIDVARESIAPVADEMDATQAPPRPQMLALAETGLLGIMISQEFGGQGGSLVAGVASSALLASACGVTNFVAIQHFFATRILDQHAETAFKAEFFPRLASGAWLTGVCAAHLSHTGPMPVVSADYEGDQVVFFGKAPWFTGWGVLDHMMLGATLPDGRAVVVLADIGAAKGIRVKAPYDLEVLAGTNTVSPEFVDFQVPRSRVAFVLDDAGDLDPGMRIHLTAAGSSLGVAGAAALRIKHRGEEREDDTLVRVADQFGGAISDAWSRVLRMAREEHATFEEREWLRAEANLLSIRATFALVAATGGSADLVGNIANRLYREAFAYTFNAHTSGLRDAILQGLARDL